MESITMQAESQIPRSHESEAHIVGALMADGQAYMIEAKSHKDAIHMVATLKSGKYGRVLALCIGVMNGEPGQPELAEIIHRRLAGEMRIH